MEEELVSKNGHFQPGVMTATSVSCKPLQQRPFFFYNAWTIK